MLVSQEGFCYGCLAHKDWMTGWNSAGFPPLGKLIARQGKRAVFKRLLRMVIFQPNNFKNKFENEAFHERAKLQGDI